MKVDKKTFLKNVTILIDTREKEFEHIAIQLDRLGVAYVRDKVDIGDYSFNIEDKDFSQVCVVERKANIDELYQNVMQDRKRIEKEFEAAKQNLTQFVLLIENCASYEELKAYEISEKDMERYKRKVKDIGNHCYRTLMSWQCGNRYNFRTVFVNDNNDSTAKMLEQFYYYWRNYKEQIKPRR